MDPQLSGFALGLLFGAAKLGLLGTIACGIGWWRAHRRLRQLEQERAEPSLMEERLTALEQSHEYLAGQLERIAQGQEALLRRTTAHDRLPGAPSSTER